MDSTLKVFFIESRNTKFGVLTKELCKLQVMKKISNNAAPIAAEATVFRLFRHAMSSNSINLHIYGL